MDTESLNPDVQQLEFPLLQFSSAGEPEAVIMKIGGWRTRSVFEGYAIISLRLALPMLSENWKSATGIAKTKRTKALRLLGIRQRFRPREHAASCREGESNPQGTKYRRIRFPVVLAELAFPESVVADTRSTGVEAHEEGVSQMKMSGVRSVLSRYECLIYAANASV